MLEQQCKNAVQSVKELNDAMTLVSMTMPDMTNDGLQNLANQSLQMAKELSTYSKTVTDAVTIYANANETASGILTKAQPTVLLASASGMSASNAADTIQGVLNQFDMTEERAMEVADVVEKLSSEISVDFSKGISDISSAIKNSGSVVNEAGMSFEKYAAIVSSTAEKTRENGSVLGNAYKTIFSRISRSKDGETTDAEKSKAEEALASVGVSVRGMNGDLRDVSDTLDDLNAVWGTLTRSQKSYIAEQAAGTRQKSIFIATMDNYNRALELEKKAVNSSGTAMEINEKRVDSIDGKMQKLSATMTEMYNDAFSDEMIKGLLDFATALVEVADNFGLLQGALAAVGAGAMANTVGRIVANWGTIAAFFTNPITIGAGVVGGIVAVASAYKNSVSEMVDSAKQAGDAWEESNSSIQSNIEKITDLRTALDSGTLSEQEAYDVKSQLLEIQSSLTEAYGLESGSLDLVNGKYDEQIAKLKELADVQANQFLNENRDGIKTAKKKMTENQQYELGEVWTNSEEFKGIKEIVDKYSDKGITGEDYNGTYRIKFEGDATQAESVLQSFATDVRAFQQEVGESGTTELILDRTSDALKDSTDILDEYQELYNQAMKADLQTDKTDFGGKTAAEWLNNYAKAVENYNDAVSSGSTEEVVNAKDYYNKINNSVQGLLKGSNLSQYSALFEDVSGQLDKAAIKANEFNTALNTDTNNEFLNGYQKHIQSVTDDIKKLDMSDVEFKAAINTGDIDSINYLAQAAETAGISTDALVSSLVNLGVLSGNPSGAVEEVSSSIDDFRTSVEDAIEAQDNLKSAFISSKSATGLTTEEIENVTDAYKDLEGFDAETLFENTANGVHLNTDAMKLLNEQLEATTKQGYLEQIAAKQKEINDLLSENPQADVSGLQEELSTLQQLSAQYDAATSAYNNFIKAQSGGNERDSYENVAKSYESMKETLEQGWYGDESLNSYLDLMLSVSQRTGDAQADFEKLDKTIEGTSHSLLDYFVFNKDDKLVTDGLFDFLDDVNTKLGDEYAKIGEHGYEFDFTGEKLQEVADMFGTTPEMIQLFERAMIDAGMAVELGGNDLNDYASKMDELTQKTDEAKEKLKEMQKEGNGQISSSLDLDYNAAEMSLDGITAKIEELKQERITVEASGNTEGLQAIDDEISALQNQQIYMSIQTQVDSGTSIDELLSMEDEQLSATLSIDTSQVDAARKQLESLNGETAEASVSVNQPKEATVKVTPEQEEIEVKVKDATVKVTPDPEEVEVSVKPVPVQTDNVEGQTDGITVKVHVDSSEEQNYQPQDKEATVTYNKDSSIPDDYVAPDKSAIAKYSVDAWNVYSWTPPTKTGTVVYQVRTSGSILGALGRADGTLTPALSSGTAYNVLNMKPAYANGKVALDKNEQAVVNELGTEGIIRNGRLFAIPGGMHMENLKKGDIILSAKQMKDLFSGKDAGHARAYADGTVGQWFANAYDSGTGGTRRPSSGVKTHTLSGKSSSKQQTTSSTTETKQNTSAVNTNTKAVKQSSQAFDWIRVALDRAKSKVEEIAATITDFVSSAYKSAQLQKQITAIDNEIVANQKGYSAYLEKANSVAKKYKYQDDNGNARSLSIPSKYKKLVQNGTFSVEDMDTSTAYGKALAEAVQKYQEYYEAAQDCRRAVQELRTEQYEAFQELMNIPTEEAEKKIDKLERKLKSLTAVQSTTSMGGSAIAQLQKLTKANNPEVKKTTDALKKAQDAQVKTATAKSTAAKEKSSANKILQNAKTSTLKSGANLSKDAKKATNTYANALKNATKKGVSSSIVSAVNSAIKKRQPISSSLLKKLKGSALKAAKDYNAKLKQEQTINKSVSSSKSVSTKGLTGQLLKDAQKYNKDAKAQASAQKVYDKAVSNYNSATSKDNVAKQKVENATLAKKNAENATTQEQRTLINAQSDQASYIYQNKFLDQQLSVAKSENSARQTALDKATKNAENAQKKKQQQTAKIQKQATALLKNKSVTKALNDTQKAALKAGKTVSTTGITNPAVLKKIKAYNDMVKQGTVLNTQYTIAIEAQSEAVANAAEAEAEYAEMIVENEKQKFENIQNYYNGISDYNQKLSESYAGNRNIKSAKGQDLTEKDYQDEIASRQKDRQILADEEAALRKQLDSAVKSGKIIKGSDEWLEMASQIREVHNEGQSLELTVMELQDTMREDVFFQAISKALDKAEALRASLGSINDLISDEMKYDDNGKLTNFGITALAMDIKDYESYLDSMQILIKKRNEYIKQFNNGNNNTNYSQKEFDEDMKNISDDIRNLLSQTNDARKSIIDSITSQSKAELDAINKVIDARQNLLKKQKEYYDYDKTLKSKTKDIQLLEQQIAALDGVNDAESKARKAQLEAQLKEAKDDLDDTIFEHRYDIQVSGLDDLKTELQDNYDNYVKDLNSNLETIVGAVDTSTANINNCLNTVNDTITKLLNSFNIEGLTGEVVGIPSYASGTKNAKGGLSRINDGNGDEIVILKDGSVLMPLTKGSQVLSARETADQIAFSSLNKEMPTYKIPEINMPTMSQKEPATISPVIQCPITINGNADGQDIARELNKRMPEITKQVSMGIYKDLKKNGY